MLSIARERNRLSNRVSLFFRLFISTSLFLSLHDQYTCHLHSICDLCACIWAVLLLLIPLTVIYPSYSNFMRARWCERTFVRFHHWSGYVDSIKSGNKIGNHSTQTDTILKCLQVIQWCETKNINDFETTHTGMLACFQTMRNVFAVVMPAKYGLTMSNTRCIDG